MKTNFKQMLAATAVAAAFAAPAAQATPVSELYFTQSAGWVDPTDADPGTFFNSAGSGMAFSMIGSPLSVPPYPTAAPVYSGMQWIGSTAAAPSMIEIMSYTDASSPSNDGAWNAGEYWIIDRLLQTNNVQTGAGLGAPNPLWIADTLANLRIFSDAGHTDLVFDDLNSPTRIRFWETLNTGTGGAGCGSPNPLGTNCDDIYTVLSSEFDPISWVMDGYKYTLTFTLVPGPGTLVVPQADGTILVYTPENNPGTSEIFVAMKWDATSVPEPSMIALLGGGLLAAGFAARRRKV